MLLANYGSDSGSGSESDSESKPQAGPSVPKPTAPPPVLAKGKKRGGPVKITLDLPKDKRASNHDDGDGDAGRDDDDDDVDQGLSAKKAKTGLEGLKGKGSSSLLGMLPPPKRKIVLKKEPVKLSVNKSMAAKPLPQAAKDEDEDYDENDTPKSGLLLPSSLARQRMKAKEEEPVDLFGIAAPSTSAPAKLSSTRPLQLSISSAPPIAEFVPPEPTPNDPYPGYYQLPGGHWAAYEPDYYHSFFPDSSAPVKPEKGSDGRIGHHWDEYDTKGGNVLDINVNQGLEDARKEEERKARMVKPKMPGDEYEYQAIGQIKGVAAQRHQLTSLLHTAFSQREDLENRISQNKKNMRLAGQKYGF